MPITFAVDRVKPELSTLEKKTLAETARALIGTPLELVSHQTTVLASPVPRTSVPNALLTAVHMAFAEHRPLSLSPDHIWLAIAQGFALHLEQHGEQLRSRFVRHEGKAELRVDSDSVPSTPQQWGQVIGQFGQGIAGHVGPGLHRLLTCSFSTTTPIERVASEVVMMSAFQRYFDYVLMCICGIPTITLEGEPGDWIEIRRRVDVIAEYDLEWWAKTLRPICDAFVKTAQGQVDTDFWQCIYKPKERYGGEDVTGWITRLFPYLEAHGGARPQNPAVLDAPAAKKNREVWISTPIAPSAFPPGICSAPLRVAISATGTERTLSLFGGFFGVAQLESGALRPEIGWAIGERPRMTAILDRIEREHTIKPKVETDSHSRQELPADLIELYARCDGALLFDRFEICSQSMLMTSLGSPTRGFYGVKPFTQLTEGYNPSETIAVTPFCSLRGDPRFIATMHGDDGFVIVLCDPTKKLHVEEIPVIADDVCSFLEDVIANEGRYYFDEPNYRPLGSVYVRLDTHHSALRRSLQPGYAGPPPADLTQRELEQLVLVLCNGNLDKEERTFYWDALRRAVNTDKKYNAVFKKRRIPYDIMIELGIRQDD